MTTAHRPTFVPRKGNNIFTDIPTLQFSVKDLPSNTTLKLRFNERDGRYYNEDDFLRPRNKEEERKRMIKELKKREREEKRKKQKEEEKELLFLPNKRKKISETISEKIDNKEEIKNKNEEKEEKNEEENEEDSEEELLKELEKIKKEQEEENKRKNEQIKEKMEKEIINLKEIKEKKEKESENSIGISFDLYNDNNFSSFSLSKPEEFSLKKKWYEESLFKNQSRKETKPKKRFINDSVHSDFHYRFLDKAIQ